MLFLYFNNKREILEEACFDPGISKDPIWMQSIF